MKLTESKLRKMVKETIKNCINENKFKNGLNKAYAVIHMKGKKMGKSDEEIKKDMENFHAKQIALLDINRDRDVRNMSSHEREFNNYIRPDTLDINFDDINDEYDDVSIDDLVNIHNRDYANPYDGDFYNTEYDM